MATLTVQKPTLRGATSILSGTDMGIALTTCFSGGDDFPNTGVEFLLIKNGHAATARTVTFDAPKGCNFGLSANAAHDCAVLVSALHSKLVGPFPTGTFNDTNAKVQMTYSDAAADLTVAVLSLS